MHAPNGPDDEVPPRPSGRPDATPSQRQAMWHLLAERHTTVTSGPFWGSELLGEYYGTYDQALAMLEERARTYVPEHPWNRTRIRLYRTADGFMQVNEGLRERRWICHFRAVELLWDSGPAPQGPDVAFPGAPSTPPLPPPPPNPPQAR